MITFILGTASIVAFLVLVVIYAIISLAESDRSEERIMRFAPSAITSGGNSDPGLTDEQIRSQIRHLKKAQEARSSGLGRFQKALTRAGLQVPTYTFYIRSMIVGAVASAISVLLGVPLLVIPFVFVGVAYIAPLLLLKFIAGRRQRQFTQLFPDALDVIARGLRAGLPMDQSFAELAREADPPVSEIFTEIVDETAMGMETRDAMMRALERMPTAEMMFFVTVVNIAEETGGSLSHIIENISDIIRARASLTEEIKAKTSNARTSALILGSLPFGLGGVMYGMSPEHIRPLFTTDVGHLLLGAGGFWLLIGVLVMWRIIASVKV